MIGAPRSRAEYLDWEIVRWLSAPTSTMST
jgi:hypothetical protein